MNSFWNVCDWSQSESHCFLILAKTCFNFYVQLGYILVKQMQGRIWYVYIILLLYYTIIISYYNYCYFLILYYTYVFGQWIAYSDLANYISAVSVSSRQIARRRWRNFVCWQSAHGTTLATSLLLRRKRVSLRLFGRVGCSRASNLSATILPHQRPWLRPCVCAPWFKTISTTYDCHAGHSPSNIDSDEGSNDFVEYRTQFFPAMCK